MAPTPELKRPTRSSASLLERMRQVGILFALLATVLVFSSLTPTFLTASNLTNIVLQSSVNAIIAIGMTLVIILGGIDLSVGPVLALVAVVTATVMLHGTSIPVAILVGLGIGVLAGLINGWLIAHLQLQPFIVTLGTMSLFRGLALIYTNGDPIFQVPQAYRSIFAGYYAGVPGPIAAMRAAGQRALAAAHR